MQPTGSGKSLLFQMIATFLKGVTLCLSPLLSLSADQVNKLMGDETMITALHLDECEQRDLPEIMALIKNLQDSSTLFIFSSPQAITDKFKSFGEVLIQDRLIKFVVVDEVHLFTHFGRTFREEFNHLNEHLFSKMPSTTPMPFLTATCSTEQIDVAFQKMTRKSITHCEWPIPSTIMYMGNR